MYNYLSILSFFLICLTGCHGQKNHEIKSSNQTTESGIIGGPFENAEFMYIGMPQNISNVDTSAGWFEAGQKLQISGIIYQPDGKTPASDVILYYYHTDINGKYTSRSNLDPKIRRHGYLRGWVKTDNSGKYSINTIRPAPYPENNEPAHIHLSIKEPHIDKEYYIDEFVFDDDILLTTAERKKMRNRGGSGVLRLLNNNGIHVAENDIILGLNIPNYPKSPPHNLQSGRSIGEDIISFTPYHAWGPDKGKKTCPICKYGRYHGLLYFAGNKPDWTEVKLWLQFLESESSSRGKYLKAYFILGDEIGVDRSKSIQKLESIGKELSIKKVALTLVPSFADTTSDIAANRINSDVSNTIIVFRQSNIINKYIEIKATQENFKLISDYLDKTRSEFFDLSQVSDN